MAYKWPDLDPDEIQDYSVDWSRFLKTNTIASVVWQINGTTVASYGSFNNDGNELTLVQPTNTTTVATVRLTSGVVGTRYKLTCRITTASGEVFERKINLTIRER